MRNKNINFSFTTESDKVEGYFDQDKLDKILFNLLSNALKYTPANKSVSVCVDSFKENSHNFIRINVKDEGKGIDAKEIDNLNCTEQENVGQRMDIYQSLKKLKEAERTCITLFYMEDVSIDKIAGIMEIPSGTVKSHLARGKEKLATYLKQNGYDGNR